MLRVAAASRRLNLARRFNAWNATPPSSRRLATPERIGNSSVATRRDTLRALDAISETLAAIGAKQLAAEVRLLHEEQMRDTGPR